MHFRLERFSNGGACPLDELRQTIAPASHTGWWVSSVHTTALCRRTAVPTAQFPSSVQFPPEKTQTTADESCRHSREAPGAHTWTFAGPDSRRCRRGKKNLARLLLFISMGVKVHIHQNQQQKIRVSTVRSREASSTHLSTEKSMAFLLNAATTLTAGLSLLP